MGGLLSAPPLFQRSGAAVQSEWPSDQGSLMSSVSARWNDAGGAVTRPLRPRRASRGSGDRVAAALDRGQSLVRGGTDDVTDVFRVVAQSVSLRAGPSGHPVVLLGAGSP